MSIPSVADVADATARHLGMTVSDVRRQTRWRPTWFVHGERDGAPFDVVVRGARVDTEVFSLRHEMTFHRMLEERGIPVARHHGWIEELGAVAMDMVPGQPDFDGVPAARRDDVVDEYLHVLARLHAMSPEPFIEAGITRPPTPEQSGLWPHAHLEKRWRSRKRQPDPFLEFCLGWMHRHPPLSHGRLTPIIWDTGQFHHRDGRLVAVLDLEFGCVADPMLDLAEWRMRDTLIPYGDFPSLYARYGELTGREVDIEAIKRHHFAATLDNQLIFGPAVADPVDETDLMNNMQWASETNLHATEALGEFIGLELPTVEPPEPRRTRHDNTHQHLVRSLQALSMGADDHLLSHQLRLSFRMARHLARVNEIGDECADAELVDAQRVLGYRPGNWYEADAELERFVVADAATGDHDEVLVWLFHRRNLRRHAQLGPPGSKMVAHYPTQRFDTAMTSLP
jgi:aminoglycoside phosphotransferase (APT) family kinase protein